MFVDEARVEVASGKGGDGAVSFHREKYRPRGGPDGGSGGSGGSVLLVADPGTSSLRHLRDHPHLRAEKGGRGSSNNRAGADANDLEVAIPVGTVVKDSDGTVLADLARAGDRFVAAGGGRGGRGNAAFLSDRRRAPRFAELGEPGEKAALFLEMRLVADVAVIGYPNAGKSSLVAAVSAARPKIAEYPFTTLEPSLGVVEQDGQRFVVCDIPGMIEGAAEGKGLGHKFLRHAERALVFVHLVDGASERGAIGDYRSIRAELEAYSSELASRPEVVAINKVDLLDSGARRRVSDELRGLGLEPFQVSAVTGEGLDALVRRLFDEVADQQERRREPEGYELFRSAGDDRVEVLREGPAWRVRGPKVEKWVAMTDLSNPEAVAYLQARLEGAGVERMLEKAGASRGDDVRIGEAEFEWWPARTEESEESGG